MVVLQAGVGACLMPVVLGLIRRGLSTMAENVYTSGASSMAFVTVPNLEVARRLAQ